MADRIGHGAGRVPVVQTYSREADRLIERIVWKRGDVAADRRRLVGAMREQSLAISDFIIARSKPCPSPVARD